MNLRRFTLPARHPDENRTWSLLNYQTPCKNLVIFIACYRIRSNAAANAISAFA